MKRLIILMLLMLCGCATASQQEVHNLQAQIHDLQIRQCTLEQKAASLDLREKQLARVVTDMLLNNISASGSRAPPAKADRSVFEACLTACWPKIQGSDTGMDRLMGEACKGIPECDRFLTDEDGRQQVLP